MTITIERTARSSWENTIDSTNAKLAMNDAFNGTINGEYVWTNPHETGIRPRYATAPSTRVHYFVKNAINELIAFLDYTGGAYISNDGIDEYCNDLESIYDDDIRNDLYAFDPEHDSPVDARDYKTQREIAEVIFQNLEPFEIEILEILSELRPAYFDSTFMGEPLPDEYDGIDVILHVFNAAMEVIDGDGKN